jgi:hypothetical protein
MRLPRNEPNDIMQYSARFGPSFWVFRSAARRRRALAAQRVVNRARLPVTSVYDFPATSHRAAVEPTVNRADRFITAGVARGHRAHVQPVVAIGERPGRHTDAARRNLRQAAHPDRRFHT